MTLLSKILLHSGVPEQDDAQCGHGGYQGGRQGDAVFAWSVKAGELAAIYVLGSWGEVMVALSLRWWWTSRMIGRCIRWWMEVVTKEWIICT